MPNTPTTAERAARRARARERTAREREEVTPDDERRRPGRPPRVGDDAGSATVRASALDLYLPKIREPNEKDLIALFEFEILEEIEGRPTYTKLKRLRTQLIRNALKVESMFGGGKTGHLGMVLKAELFAKRNGTVPWVVPESRGMFPSFPMGLTDDDKRTIILEFIKQEEHIKIAKKMEILLRNQIVKAVHDDYISELRDDFMEYDERSVLEILNHLFTNYGTIGIKLKDETMELFRSEPDWDSPIDKYYNRQQECQKTMADSTVPISDALMVDTLVTHVAKSGILSRARQKWEQHILETPDDNNWRFAKDYFRGKLKSKEDAEEDTGLEGGAAFQAKKQVRFEEEDLKMEAKEEIKKELRDEIVDKMGSSLTSIAMAASEKECNTAQTNQTIAALTATNATLSAKLNIVIDKNQRLEDEVKRLSQGTTARVPGVNKTPDETASGATWENPAWERNSNNKLCKTTKGQKHLKRFTFFADKQYCSHCKENVFHLPRYCKKNPNFQRKTAERK